MGQGGAVQGGAGQGGAGQGGAGQRGAGGCGHGTKRTPVKSCAIDPAVMSPTYKFRWDHDKVNPVRRRKMLTMSHRHEDNEGLEDGRGRGAQTRARALLLLNPLASSMGDKEGEGSSTTSSIPSLSSSEFSPFDVSQAGIYR